MTRAQALTIGILFGLVMLIFIGLAAILFFQPLTSLLFPSPTPTFTPSPTIAPTPTLPSFLPTPSLEPLPTVEPTPTNTRLPTLTPRPPRTPTPTVVFILTLPVRPTATPTPTVVIPPTVTAPLATDASATPPSLGFSITFSADDSRIDEGECTTIRWRVEGALAVRFEGKRAAPVDREKVCPKKDTTYQLTVELPDGNRASRDVEITVREDNDNNDNNG